MFKLHTNTLATIKIIVIGLLLANMTIVKETLQNPANRGLLRNVDRL